MGRAWTFGDNIDTDVITPSQYKHQGRDVYVDHAMEPIAPDFADEVDAGDIVVAGRNFGSGSSRESAAIAFLDNDVDAVVAESFARIFYRNAINIGLPVYLYEVATTKNDDGDEVEVDHEGSVVHNLTKDETYLTEPHPEFIQEILAAGGLANYRDRLHQRADETPETTDTR
jgi:3-isopropylmalate/(R)-2-methylmalate dehydratase small subunit